MDWIDVKDRLPSRNGLESDETEYVLVSSKGVLGPSVAICGFGSDGWSHWDNFGVINTKRITHWMPLPDPPISESEGTGEEEDADKEDESCAY